MTDTNETRESVLKEYREFLSEFFKAWKSGKPLDEIFIRDHEFYKELCSLGMTTSEVIAVTDEEYFKLFGRPYRERILSMNFEKGF